MSNKNNTNNKITPLGFVVAILIVCILASLAVPRLREASRAEPVSGAPKILATFGADVSVETERVIVTCKACDPAVYSNGTSLSIDKVFVK